LTTTFLRLVIFGKKEKNNTVSGYSRNVRSTERRKRQMMTTIKGNTPPNFA